MKLLLCCRDIKPYLCLHRIETGLNKLGYVDLGYVLTKEDEYQNIALNSKIVGECDYEVEKIESKYLDSFYSDLNEICKESCLSLYELIKLTAKDKLGIVLY